MAGTDAAAVLATLDDATAHELQVISRALAIAGGVFSEFAIPLWHLAVCREGGVDADSMCDLSMRHALRRCRLLLEPDEAARARLEQAEEPFWRAVRDAVSD
jgi:hypothetical protein